MKQYHELLRLVLRKGQKVQNRTGIDTICYFGAQMRFDLKKGFPAVTTKKLAWKAVVSELLWFMEGSTDERRLAEILYQKPAYELNDKETIWTANAKAFNENKNSKNELGPVYGHQWRSFGDYCGCVEGFDQLGHAIEQLKTNPDSRRIIVSAWSPSDIELMALPPCHVMYQFRVINGKLSCSMYQRSADLFLGVPFNIASYALLTHIVAREVGLEVGDLIMNFGDVHIYVNHIDQVKEQLSRKPYNLPRLKISDDFDLGKVLIEQENKKKNRMFDATLDNVEKFKLINYKHHETIKAEMAV